MAANRTFTEFFSKLQNFLYSFLESVNLSIRYDTGWQPASDGARPGPAQRSRIRVVDARDCEMTRKVAMMKHMFPCKYKNSRRCLLVNRIVEPSNTCTIRSVTVDIMIGDRGAPRPPDRDRTRMRSRLSCRSGHCQADVPDTIVTEGLRLANLLRFSSSSLGPAALRPAGHGHAGTVPVAESDAESHTETVNVHRDRRTERLSALLLQ